MAEITDLMAVPFEGNNHLIADILSGHGRVLKFSMGTHMASEESMVIARSASALYDIGVSVFQPLVKRMLDAEELGAVDYEIEENRPEIFEAMRYFATATLTLWYNALLKKGIDSEPILDALRKIKDKEVTSTVGIVGLVNQFVEPVNNKLNLETVKPKGGWAELNSLLKLGEEAVNGRGYGNYL